jgi:Ino eighty subunit 1
MESSPIAPGEPASVVRRSRPLTAHQLAVERNRNQRVDYILSRGLRKAHHRARKARRKEGVFYRTLQRINATKDVYDDSEGEEKLAKDPIGFRERGFVGLVQLETEDDDFGEEFSSYAAAFRRMGRRLDRWDLQPNPELSIKVSNRATNNLAGKINGRGSKRDEETGDERPTQKAKRNANGNAKMDDEEDLDDMDKAILGLGSENDDDSDNEEELDDVDRELLAIAGDDTEDDMSDGGMDVD